MPDHVGIVELVDVCADLRRRNELLFERLGGWVATTTMPAAQQLFAEACHRHAWHAELWSHRLPTIGRSPGVAFDVAFDDHGDHGDPIERVDDYRSRLTDLAERHDGLRRRLDALVDPATVRVLDLVDADLEALTARLDALEPVSGS